MNKSVSNHKVLQKGSHSQLRDRLIVHWADVLVVTSPERCLNPRDVITPYRNEDSGSGVASLILIARPAREEKIGDGTSPHY